MPDDKIEFTFKCKACGATLAASALPEDGDDSSMVTCQACGTNVGRYGDLKAHAKSRAVEAMRSELKKAFKGIKGFKVK
ncbi:ECs_2282 family putative zinc-binding protein [Paracoccus yeei]|uniref:ECs_2282 family putative zinc-binding protein n=1 Tax=Paracoccus yeei TaxID=147645 RepID=UPI003BF8D3FD